MTLNPSYPTILVPNPTVLRPRIFDLARRGARTLALIWIALNVLTYAPTVDEHGNCDCPFCHPFDMRRSIPK